jgi:hypothetical protein
MQRCMQCNSPLTSAETICYSCESPVAKRNPKEFSDRFRTSINVLFVIFALITVGSPFIETFPSFWKCFAGLGVLYLVKNSADNMSEFRKK